MKKPVIIAVAVAIAVVAFAGGALLAPRLPFLGGATRQFAGGPGAGGPMMNLSEEDRAKVEGMSDEERREFFQERMGEMGGADRAGGGGPRGGTLEGEVMEVAEDSFTVQTSDGGSQNIYIDADTVLAFAEDVEAADLKTGDAVIVVAEPEADGVMSATAVIVK